MTTNQASLNVSNPSTNTLGGQNTQADTPRLTLDECTYDVAPGQGHVPQFGDARSSPPLVSTKNVIAGNLTGAKPHQSEDARLAAHQARLKDSQYLPDLRPGVRAMILNDQKSLGRTVGKWFGGLATGLLGGGAIFAVAIAKGVIHGASIGTLICPGYGTVVGAVLGVVGGIVLGVAGWHAGAGLGEWSGGRTGRSVVRETEEHLQEQGLAEIDTQRNARSGLPLRRLYSSHEPHVHDLTSRFEEFRNHLFLARSEESRADLGTLKGRAAWQEEIASGASEAIAVRVCRRLPATDNITDLAFDFEMATAEACDDMVDALRDDSRSNEHDLAQLFADVHVKSQHSYQVCKEHFRRNFPGETFPPHLRDVSSYFKFMMRAALQRRIPANEKAFAYIMARELLGRQSSCRRLYLASRVMVRQTDHPIQDAARQLRDCMRTTLLIISEPNQERFERELRNFDAETDRPQGRHEKKENPDDQIARPRKKEWSKPGILESVADVLPRLLGAKEALSWKMPSGEWQAPPPPELGVIFEGASEEGP